MASKTLNLDDTLYSYLIKKSIRKNSILEELSQKNLTLSGGMMQISEEQGQFMGLLVELIGAKKILEIGTFTGYSTLAMALALGDDGSILTCDINEETTAIAQTFWQEAGVQHKIDLRLAPAMQTLTSLIEQGHSNQFDMAFIDADKRGYDDYYEAVLQLMRQGGLILFDNMLQGGEVVKQKMSLAAQAINALNEKLLDDQRVSISLLPISDGVTLARKR